MTLPGFTECPECEGGLEYPTPSFSESHPLPVPCPSCSGVGVVPDPETVEVCAAASWHSWWEYKREPWRIAVVNRPREELDLWRDQARAALLAYAQHAKETE